MEYAGLSAFSVFFMQDPPFLAHQKMMADRKDRSNIESLFDTHEVLSDNQIRSLLDGLPAHHLFAMFDAGLQLLKETDQLKTFRSFKGELLMPLDETE